MPGPHLGHTWGSHMITTNCVICNVHLEPDVDALRPLVAHHPHEALAGQEAQLAPDKIIFISHTKYFSFSSLLLLLAEDTVVVESSSEEEEERKEHGDPETVTVSVSRHCSRGCQLTVWIDSAF